MDMVGSRLRDARRRRGWSQLRLAAEAGLGHATVERCEPGEAMPRLENLESMAKALRVRPEWLLVGNQSMVAHEDLSLEARAGSPDSGYSSFLIGAGGPWHYATDGSGLVGAPDWMDTEVTRRGTTARG